MILFGRPCSFSGVYSSRNRRMVTGTSWPSPSTLCGVHPRMQIPFVAFRPAYLIQFRSLHFISFPDG